MLPPLPRSERRRIPSIHGLKPVDLRRNIKTRGLKKVEQERDKLTQAIAEYKTSHELELKKIEKTLKDPNGQVKVSGGMTVEDAVKIFIMDFQIRQKFGK